MADSRKVAAGIVAGSVAAIGAGIGLILAHRATAPTPTPTPSPTPSPTPTGADLEWTAATFATVDVAPGNRVILSLAVTNAGSEAGTPTLASQAVTLNGATVSDVTFAIVGTPPTVEPGRTASVNLLSTPIPSQYAGETLGVALELGGGSGMGKTITGSVYVERLPADLEFVENYFGTINVQVGQHAQFTAQIVNHGQTAGTPQMVSGVTTFEGVVRGHWTIVNPPTIQPGQTATVTFESDGPIAAQFGGDTLGVAIQIA